MTPSYGNLFKMLGLEMPMHEKDAVFAAQLFCGRAAAPREFGASHPVIPAGGRSFEAQVFGPIGGAARTW